MEREYVTSSMMVSVGYDPATSILEIEFKSDGSVWRYYDFSESNYHAFRNSGSLGKYFHVNIRGQYTESRVS